MNVKIEPSWKKALADEWDKDYFETLTRFVRGRYAERIVYPPAGRIFAAFDACPFDDVKVVILGQDPYPGAGQANGLSFSVNPEVDLPRSLRNIYTELSADLGCQPPSSGDLSFWARQGVLLLNSTLTVDAGAPASHQNHGWETFTDAAIRRLAEGRDHLVFILWGAYAQRKGEFIDRSPLRDLLATSVASECLARIFREPPVFKSQCLSCRAWHRAGQMVGPLNDK